MAVDSPSMPTTSDRYHHGDLPDALRRAAVDVISERGIAGFSLREVARRAGVSHTAPAHHFGDVRGLLTSVAAEGFAALKHATATAAAEHDDPIAQLIAIGQAYVDLGRTHPGHCAVMFRPDLVDQGDDHLLQCSMSAYGVLERTVQGVIEHEGVDADLDDVTWMCWSTTQGLVELGPKFDMISELRGHDPVPPHDLVRRFTALIVRGLRD